MSFMVNIENMLTLRVSEMAETLMGSEIIKLAAEIKERINKGEKIYNLTIGDFNPQMFPIPQELTTEVIKAYQQHETNYPPADGLPELRQAVSRFLHTHLGLEYNPSQILIAAGARPLIYSVYKTLLDQGEYVVFPVPSWNNNHYTHLMGARPLIVEAHASNNFMPTAHDLKPYLEKATLIALCSPQNPTGTAFSRQQLMQICEIILEENIRRAGKQKPLYLLYDQIYWALTYHNTYHHDPVSLFPEMKNFTIYIDGISKTFAATGVRVGWAVGPQRIIDKMKSVLGHVGAWAPRPEQVATAHFLNNDKAVDSYLAHIKQEAYERLDALYQGLITLKKEGYKVDAIEPQAAIYLTTQFNLSGYSYKGKIISTTQDITNFLLNEAHLAVVPFHAFGASRNSSWFRLSVGTISKEEIPAMLHQLREALSKLA